MSSSTITTQEHHFVTHRGADLLPIVFIYVDFRSLNSLSRLLQSAINLEHQIDFLSDSGTNIWKASFYCQHGLTLEHLARIT